jgi:DNA-binding NarL/FixJ family response regulator
VTTIVLADDQDLVRSGLRALLTTRGVDVVAEAEHGLAAVHAAREHRPDVVVMDIRMPVMDGIEATRRITADPVTAGTRVLILTTFDLDEYVYAGLRAGASGFLLKDTRPEQLLDAIRILAAGEALLAPSITRRLIQEFAARPDRSGRPAPPMLEGLSKREREVLVEVASGLTNAEIGERLYISGATAKTHVSRLLTKLQARDRAQLVMIAYETGLVTPS